MNCAEKLIHGYPSGGTYKSSDAISSDCRGFLRGSGGLTSKSAVCLAAIRLALAFAKSTRPSSVHALPPGGWRQLALSPMICIAIAVAIPSLARAATITVNTTADPGSPGVCALRDAIAASNTQAPVNGCPAGSGADTINFSVSGTINLTSGGLNVSATSLTIDGAKQTVTIDGQSRYRVLAGQPNSTLTVNNLTIAHGFVGGVTGGAICCFGGGLTVTNSTFANNFSSFGGGAIASRQGQLSIANSTFTGNIGEQDVGGFGGAIYTFDTDSVTITNSTFSGNLAHYGGAVWIGGDPGITTLTLTGSTFSGNSASLYGGAIFSSACGGSTILNSTFYRNGQTGALQGGAAPSWMATQTSRCKTARSRTTVLSALCQAQTFSPILSRRPERAAAVTSAPAAPRTSTSKTASSRTASRVAPARVRHTA